MNIGIFVLAIAVFAGSLARVCELAKSIIEAQKREIAEMEWLISDISENGTASTAAEAAARPIPEFTGDAIRDCP